MDANYHLSEDTSDENSWSLSEKKEIIVRDPNCYGFNYCEIGIPIIRIGDLKNPFIDFTNVERISIKTHNKFNKTHLQKYDILMSVRGVSIGKIGIFLGEYEDANISPNIIIIRLKDKILAPYVAMVLVSEIGQSQIKRIVAGSAKPTITAPLINQIRIPIPSKDELHQVNKLFGNAEQSRIQAKRNLSEIAEIFKDKLIDWEANKEVSYSTNFKRLGKRWDSHYHNPCFQKLRESINLYKGGKQILSSMIKNVTNVIQPSSEEKIGYIEINSVNNVSGNISEYKVDYPKKLPKGGKIEIEKNDILVSKVRTYRNAITIFRESGVEIVTASKNAFAVYRTRDTGFPYYILAFLRNPLGLNQIVMKQSGTTYPTVSSQEINTVTILLLSEALIEKINDMYAQYFLCKDAEDYARSTILAFVETSDFE